MNNQKVTLLVLLDLSSAFDTVDHQVLLRRLQVTFGITGNALEWFRSYLSGRSQRVVINGSHSREFPLMYGVPQGSCLGPLLFIVYSSKLFEVIKNHLPDAHAYADDTQLYISFKPDSTASELEAVTSLQNCIADIKTWMTVDKLKLNDDKTEFIIIGTHAQLNKIKITELRIGQNSNPVVEIYDRTFDRLVSQEPVFINFYVPWSKESKAIHETWKNLGKLCQKEGLTTIAQIDCSRFSEVCKKYEV
ncbi:RNA-directed DNA polymerase from transposon X-element [Paramuricea clavata]|uniref:RNA-directed DNA polymerase from transposon X-element n=1 Tax=Paramuricea clavata TaxID=317549 RepID=A0A6S7H440_PARCT|nr:RNA-directed DNA polymerase from transposon X-element [Paramuricea clavata]